MKWLTQYIRESQANYPSISKTPASVLEHMLFCKGNGVEIVKGNFVVVVGFYRAVPFIEYYKEQLPFVKLKDYLDDRAFDKEVEEIYARLKRTNEMFKDVCKRKVKTDNELWGQSCDKFTSRYDDILIVDSLEPKELQDVDTLVSMVELSEYQPHLQLSAKYYQLYYFSSETNQDLLKVGLAMCKAYVLVLTRLLNNPSLITKSPAAPRGLSKERLAEVLNTYTKDIEILSSEIPRLEYYIR